MRIINRSTDQTFYIIIKKDDHRFECKNTVEDKSKFIPCGNTAFIHSFVCCLIRSLFFIYSVVSITPIAIVSPPRRRTKRPSDRHSENGSITILSLTANSILALTPLVNARGRSFFTDMSGLRIATSLVSTVGTSRLCM